MKATVYNVLTLLNAAFRFVFGFFAKLLNMEPRHEQIVKQDYRQLVSPILTKTMVQDDMSLNEIQYCYPDLI